MATPSLGKLRRLQAEAQALLQGHSLASPEEIELSPLRRVLLFCARVYHSFNRNRCPVRAAALAYTNLLALVPLLAVAVSVSASMLKSQGQQSIQDLIREAITRVAPALGLKTASGDRATPFQPDDVADKDVDRFAAKLQNTNNAVSTYLWDSRFSDLSKTVITNQAVPVEQRKAALAAELNKVASDRTLYDTNRFAHVSLSKQTVSLLALNKRPYGDDLIRLNRALLVDAYPITQDALESAVSQITDYVSNFQSGKLGVSAVLALIFLAISLLATVETTLNDIWGVTRGRGWFARIVQYWAALTLGPMFLLSAFTLTTWAKVSKDVLEQLPLLRFFLPFVVPLTILTIGCALLYLVMPNTKVPWQAALLGGFVAGALIQLNSLFNVMYVSRALTYKQLYGSMAALPLFLLGLYLSWLLVLMGAQVAYTFQNRQAYVQEKRAENVSQRGREFLAVRLMTHLAQRFQAGQRPATASEMAEELRAPLRLVGQLMSALLQSGLVLEVAAAESAYSPGRPLNKITALDILQALRAPQGQEMLTCDDPARQVVCKEFEVIEEAWQQAARGFTLEDLARQATAAAS